MVCEWVSSLLHFSVPYLRSPGASRRRRVICCSALGHNTKVLFLGEHLSLKMCRNKRKAYCLVEAVLPPPVEQHRSVIAVALGYMQPNG